MKKVFASLVLSTALFACGGSTEPKTENSAASEQAAQVAEQATPTADASSYDAKRGEGKFTAENVNVGAKLDATLAGKGEGVSGTKCTSCHKLTDEKLVGPGWKGVTTRRTPEWIMNFITNPDPMIDKDPEVQAQLELCLVRMPNQGLTDDEARSILEFMRKNDGVN